MQALPSSSTPRIYKSHRRGARVRPEPRCGTYTVSFETLALSAEYLRALLQIGSKHEAHKTQILTGSPRSCANRPQQEGPQQVVEP